MGFFNKIKEVFSAPKPVNDDCASGYPNWHPNADWKPEFDDNGATPEEYHGD